MADNAATDGSYTLFEQWLPRGAGAEAHVQVAASRLGRANRR
ncbi:hypothetical protein ACT3UM_10545 [Halomonas sp. AOP13-D3-9]